MRTTSIALIIGLAAAGTALGHQGVTNPGVMARMHSMTDAKSTLRVLTDMASAKAPFDAGKAETAKTALIANAQDIPGLFKDRHEDPKSEALPLIWSQFDDFTAKAKDSETAFRAIQTDDLDSMRTTLIPAAATCLSCHQTYRQSKK